MLHAAQEGHPARSGRRSATPPFCSPSCTRRPRSRGARVRRDPRGAPHEKILRRHPHVFGDAPRGRRATRRPASGRVQKRLERGPEHPSVEEEALPAAASGPAGPAPGAASAAEGGGRRLRLARCRARSFPRSRRNWRSCGGHGRRARPRAVREEAGDLLFAVVNLVRALGLDAEMTMRAASRQVPRAIQPDGPEASARTAGAGAAGPGAARGVLAGDQEREAERGSRERRPMSRSTAASDCLAASRDAGSRSQPSRRVRDSRSRSDDRSSQKIASFGSRRPRIRHRLSAAPRKRHLGLLDADVEAAPRGNGTRVFAHHAASSPLRGRRGRCPRSPAAAAAWPRRPDRG